jgi:hypothetical protein
VLTCTAISWPVYASMEATRVRTLESRRTTSVRRPSGYDQRMLILVKRRFLEGSFLDLKAWRFRITARFTTTGTSQAPAPAARAICWLQEIPLRDRSLRLISALGACSWQWLQIPRLLRSCEQWPIWTQRVCLLSHQLIGVHSPRIPRHEENQRDVQGASRMDGRLTSITSPATISRA